MRPYDSRPVTLDPGLTALTLRALHDRRSRYPFLDRYMGRKPAVVVVGTRRTPLYLLIVHRDHPKLFKALENTLGGVPRFLHVLMDRRTGQRRRSSAITPRADRRHGEQRRNPPGTWEVFGLLLAPRGRTGTARKRRVTTDAG